MRRRGLEAPAALAAGWLREAAATGRLTRVERALLLDRVEGRLAAGHSN